MAIEQKHTPGPWRAVGGDELVFVARPNIAHVGVTGGRAHEAPFVIVGNPGPKGSEKADAHLIAAAPDMLAALRSIAANTCCERCREAALVAQAAIAKATA